MSFAIDVKYEYITNTAKPGYFCITIGLVITRPGVKITSFNGVHQNGMTDNDVREFNTTKQNTDYLPHGLAEKFVNLETLYVIESGLKAITRNDFESMTKLKEIAFYGNRIDEIPDNCFDDLVNLEKLSLSNNRIKYLPNEIFHQLPNFVEIYISGNNLQALASDLFVNNPHINIINLRANNLKSIGDGIINSLKELKIVSLENNTCISDNFPTLSLENLSEKIKNQCSAKDSFLDTQIELNLEVQESNKKFEDCEKDKITLEKLQLSLMVSVSNYKKSQFTNRKKLDFLEDENVNLRLENDQLKKSKATELDDLRKIISSLKEDLATLEKSSKQYESNLEKEITSLLTKNSNLKASETNLKSQNEQLIKQIEILNSKNAVVKPTNSTSNGVDPKQMELAYNILMFAIEKFKGNDQNKPSSYTKGNKNSNTKKSQIELIFHHNG